MSPEQQVIFGILAAAGILFASGRVRPDLVALLVVVALLLTGASTPAEAVAGFGNTVVIMIASLLVVGEGLTRTGIASIVGQWIVRHGAGKEGRIRALVMIASAVLGSVMSSTAVVALFLPVVMMVARENRLAPGRLLLPLSYGALISGMMTLIGTAPNLVVHGELKARGHEGFNFFTFTPIGCAVLVVAVVCFTLAPKLLLRPPAPGAETSRRPGIRDLWHSFVADKELHCLRIGSDSEMRGMTPRSAGLGRLYGVRILAVQRGASPTRSGEFEQPGPDLVFGLGDILWLAGPLEKVLELTESKGLKPMPMLPRDIARLDQALGVAVVLVHPESELVGKTLEQTNFRTRQNLHVIGVKRDRQPLPGFHQEPLKAADTLLVLGAWSRIARLTADTHDFVVLEFPAELSSHAPARRKAPLALLILAAMVIASATSLLPVMTSSLLAAILMVMTRCLRMTDAYRSIHFSSVVLIAGLMPLASALERSGGVGLVVDGMLSLFAGFGPYAIMAVLFLTTTLLGALLSNTATAVLMAPIAISAAITMGFQPHAFAMAVAIASSAAYMTPVSSPVVTLVVEPGNLNFADFLRAGTPMLLLTMAICLLLVPLLIPFGTI